MNKLFKVFKHNLFMEKRGNKKGLSTIVATLLVILLTLVAVGIIWMVLRNMIQDNAEEISFGKFTVDLDITHARIINDTSINTTVKRNPGEGEIYGILFIVYDVTNSELKRYNISLAELQERRFNLMLSDLNTTNVQKLSIAPIFRLESGKESVGEITDEWVFNSTVVIPSSPPPSSNVPSIWTGELVVNGGFESGTLNNWESTPDYYVTTTSHYSGNYATYYQSPGSNVDYYIRQDIDLGAWAGYISSGDARINVSGWGISLEPNDRTVIQYLFLDSSSNVIEVAHNSTYRSSTSPWWPASLNNYPVPDNTRYLRIFANTYDIVGGPESGALDAFSARLGYFD